MRSFLPLINKYFFILFQGIISIIKSFWINRRLIYQLTKLEIKDRYKGSYFGVFWSILTPLGMLLVYTFVFSVIIKLKWEGGLTGNHSEYAISLFSGLIAFNFFSEALLSAPNVIINNPNYVKKIIFPVEILPVIKVFSALIHSFLNIIILLIGTIIVFKTIPLTVFYLPLIYIPLILFCLGLCWFIASSSVFIQDINHALGIGVQMLFFLSPVFYPILAVPESIRSVFYLNPLVFIINNFRNVILWGNAPDFGSYLVILAVSIIVCLSGFLWFCKGKKGFADVI